MVPVLWRHAPLLVIVVLFDLYLRWTFGPVARPLVVTGALVLGMVAAFAGADAILARHGRGVGLAEPERLASSAVGGIAMAHMFAIFLALKPRLFMGRPYRWDVALHRWDVTLHGGEPGLALMHLPDVALRALDASYLLWYPVLSLGIAVAVFGRPGRVRGRFLLSIALLWVLGGTILATLFSSAGPVYFRSVTGQPDPFGPLIQHMDALGLTARRLQTELWRAQASGTVLTGGGVSAMPSIHVGAMFLIAIGAARTRLWLGAVAGTYAAMVFLGSVALGWHYAVDGYVVGLLVVAIWWVAGLVVRATERSGARRGLVEPVHRAQTQ